MKKITLKFPGNNFQSKEDEKIRAITPRTVTEDKFLATLLEVRKEFVIAYAESSTSYLKEMNYCTEYIDREIQSELLKLNENVLWVAESITKENVYFHYVDGEKYLSEEILEPTYALGKHGKVEAYFVIEDVD